VEVKHYTDASVILEKYGSWLKEKEMEHNLILGLLGRTNEGYYEGVNCYVVVDEGKPVLFSMMTVPAINLILSEGGVSGLEFLANYLSKNGVELPGVVGPIDAVKRFIDIWHGISDKRFIKAMDQMIYVLTEVNMPNNIEGKWRLAENSEIDTISQMLYDFAVEAMPIAERKTLEKVREGVVKKLDKKRIVCWEVDGVLVSIVVFYFESGMSRINNVYTPVKCRGNGYASALTAAASQYLLDNGSDMCCLYTDASNPTSNSIYQKIGYRFVTDSIQYLKEV